MTSLTPIIGALPFWQLGPWTLVDNLPLLNAPLQVHSFGMFVAIGLLVCLVMATWRGERKLGMNGEKVQNYGLFLIVVGWSFAHVFNMVFYHPGEVARNPLVLFQVWGSVSSYGGLIGGIIGVYAWQWMHPDDDFLLWVDHAAWTLTFAWMFGRFGCASVHDHIGMKAPEWWPLAFEIPADFYREPLAGTVRHDLGFYEALWWIVIVATVLIVDRKPRRKGLYMAIIPLMYAPVRFFLDFFRPWPQEQVGHLGTVDASGLTGTVLSFFQTQPEALAYGDTRYLSLTPAQYLSIALFLFGLYMLYRIRDNEIVEWEQYVPGKDSN
jgi:phosphatidylglycerol:prolipoprotein diacylglycerol transferase